MQGAEPGRTVVVDSGFDRLENGAKVAVREPAAQRGTGPGSGRQPKSSGSSKSNESLAAIYSAAGRDLAADGGDSAGRARGLPAAAGLGAAQVDYPTIQVVTFYPGASPDVMASSVTAPLERQFGQVPGLNQMTSTSSGGSSVITLQFALEPEHRRGRAGGAGGHQRRAARYLPADLPNPPIYSKTNPADAPILTLALTSNTLPLSQGGRPGRYAPGAEDLAVARRRPGEHQRRPEAGRAHPGQSRPRSPPTA